MQSSSVQHQPTSGIALQLLVITIIVSLLSWISTGTLAPYAASHHTPAISDPCGFLLNIDHETHRAPFLMLDGAPRPQWEWSVVLRRVLYPVLAFPAMKFFGFLAGGVITNVLLTLVTLVFFAAVLRKLYCLEVPRLGWALMITYPGIYYWIGLPYSYAFIVPGSLLAYVALCYAARYPTWRPTIACSLAIGVLSTGYDLLPFFGAGLVLLLIGRGEWRRAAVAIPLLVLPTIMVSAFLWKFAHVAPLNPNSGTYRAILQAYLSGLSFPQLLENLRTLPSLTWNTFVYSNFIALPALVIAVVALFFRRFREIFTSVDVCIVGAALLVFLTNNLAPPYAGWQLRGEWIPRLYQPVFVVGWMLSLRAIVYSRQSTIRSRLLTGAIAATIFGQLAIVIGPLVGRTELADVAYHRFYLHAPFASIGLNREKYGVRLLGACRQ